MHMQFTEWMDTKESVQNSEALGSGLRVYIDKDPGQFLATVHH